MKLDELKRKCKPHIKISWSFQVNHFDFKRDGNRLHYNSIVRQNIPDSEIHGVYIISNSNLDEVLYVGMSGQIKRLDNGNYSSCGYDIRKRLVSSRGKDDKTGKDISSSDYFKLKMEDKSIESITITIIQTNKDVSPTFLESQILQWIFRETKTLPDWNKSF